MQIKPVQPAEPKKDKPRQCPKFKAGKCKLMFVLPLPCNKEGRVDCYA